MRRPTMVALAITLLLAAACTADPPSAPPSGLRPTRAITIAYPSCDPSGIRSTMASLYKTSDLKSFALPTFNAAESARTSGNVAAARSGYYAVLEHVLDTFRGDRLQQPSRLASVQDGVFFVVASITRCAGDPVIDDLQTLVVGLGNDAPNYDICVVLATTAGAECVPSSEGAAVKLEANYLTKEALILVQPDFANLDVPLFEQDLGTTWSDVWRLRIAPLDAQRNYGVAAPPATDPQGHAAVCTIDRFDDFTHHELSDAHLLRLGYRAGLAAPAATLLTESSTATMLLDCAKYEGFWDQNEGVSALAVVPVLDAWPSRLALRGLRDVGGRATRLFTPTTLHAFDGGIGGKFASSASYFSAVETNGVYVRRNPSTETQGPVPALSLGTQQSAAVVASRTAYGVVRNPTSCTWTSSHNRVSVTTSGTGNTFATLTASRSTGTAVVTATCTYNATTSSYVTTVTVTR